VLENQGDYEGSFKAFKVADKLGEEEFRKGRLFEIAVKLGDISIMPESWKNDYASDLLFFENYFNQNWGNCLTIIDTASNWRLDEDQLLYRKASIHYMTSAIDSSKHYANQLIDYYNEYPDQLDPSLKAAAFSLLGKRSESIALIHSGVYRNSNWIPIDEEDLWRSLECMKDEVYNYVLQNDYVKATSTLLALNEKYPSYGDYIEFITDPFYNRIKKEHPPFATAVQQLKLPVLVPFDAPLKD